GGAGAISVIGNLFPKLWKQMITLALQGKWLEAERLNERLLPTVRAMFLETNPQCVKWMAEWLGLGEAHHRLPLLGIAEETKRTIKTKMLPLFLPHFSTGARSNFR
ncbi:MAG: dihydrodipicolinate synthase family protein, partial [Chlamydiia bacterium]|nr:dihydrodipicolinate synthase family protein [Chlamydiia bacterium]